MDSNKTVYWIAIGVLALGLNSEYQHGNFVALHQVADRASLALCQVSTRAEQTLASAVGIPIYRMGLLEKFSSRIEQAQMATSEAEMAREQAREQAEMVRVQVRDQIRAQRDALRAQADMRRAEIDQVRSQLGSELRLVRVDRRVSVTCPRTRKRVMVRADALNGSSQVEVSDTF